jgi:hypothetical protein
MSTLFPSQPETDEERFKRLQAELQQKYQKPLGPGMGINPAAVQAQQEKDLTVAVEGLQRAMARGAPIGQESGPIWTSAAAPDQRIYNERAKARGEAEQNQAMDKWRTGLTTGSTPIGAPPPMRSAMNDMYPFNQWGGFFEALGHNDKIASEAGPNPNMKTDWRGFGNSTGSIADDPTSTFNTTEGPFGKFGAGTGGVESPTNPTEERRKKLSITGLKAGY